MGAVGDYNKEIKYSSVNLETFTSDGAIEIYKSCYQNIMQGCHFPALNLCDNVNIYVFSAPGTQLLKPLESPKYLLCASEKTGDWTSLRMLFTRKTKAQLKG
jgi:hypothetical protein